MSFIKAYDKCNNITFINLLKVDYIDTSLKDNNVVVNH